MQRIRFDVCIILFDSTHSSFKTMAACAQRGYTERCYQQGRIQASKSDAALEMEASFKITGMK